MATIKGLFEPFASYVKQQLDIRKSVLSNSTSKTISSTKRYENNPELFYAYSTEKQAWIRLMSGVDLTDYHKLEPNEGYLHTPSGLAKQYILEGGTRYYNDKIKWGWRGGFTTGHKKDNDLYAYAYGDPNTRSDPDDNDFGIVPMPGITNANIRTKSDDGSLREAKVNFVCFNRRQLDALEMLYMRPGYPVCLEWGWNPYISNNKTRENNDYTIHKPFFDYKNTIEDLNERIRKYKKDSGGNYDGFIGYVKNFTYKSREDGGYDCTSEIIAHGEILESLKSTVKKVNKSLPNVEDPVVEYEDRFLFYLRSIKETLNGAGEQFFLARHLQRGDINKKMRLEGGGLAVNNPDQLIPPQNSFFDGQVGLPQNKDSFDESLTKINSFKEDYKNKLNDMSDEKTQNYYNTLDNTNDLQAQLLNQNQDIATQSLLGENTGNPVYSQGNTDQTFIWEDSAGNKYESPTAGAANPYGQELREMGTSYSNWNDYVQIKSQELNLNITVDYRMGFRDIQMLYNFINKNTQNTDLENDEKVFDPLAGKGFESILGGSILKQTLKYNSFIKPTSQDADPNITGGEDKVTTHTYDSGYRRNVYVRWDLICQMFNHLSQTTNEEISKTINSVYDSKNPNNNALGTPLVEFTYLGPNQRSWSNSNPEKGRISPQEENNYYLGYAPCLNNLADPSFAGEKPEDLLGQYHPVIGNSYNERICLLPHQMIFDEMFDNDKLNHEQIFLTDSATGEIKETDVIEQEENVGFNTISSYKTEKVARSMRNSVGFIYFNIQFLIDTYESLRLTRSVVTSKDGVEQNYITLNKKFNLFDYVKSIWEGANNATANYYNFRVSTEHEKANKIRIVDMRLSGVPKKDTIYTFEPQGLRSVTRQFYFDSKIDADMASMISIAAQAPNSVQSLESLSFKAFHKNIRSRFIPKDFTEGEDEELKHKQRQTLEEEVREINSAFINLTYFQRTLMASDFQGKFHIVGPEEGIKQAAKFMELRNIILHKYPLYTGINDDKTRTKHPRAGEWRADTTTDNQAIIPLQCSIQLDGIAGMIPLQLFKIDKNKLPLGYQRDDIVFITKSESHNITANQDWSTEITGQLTLLNINPNDDGYNNILEDKDPPTIVDILNDPAYALNYTPFANYLRNASKLEGHGEKDFSETSEIGYFPGKKAGFFTGELSSGGDLSPEMAAMGQIFIGCMKSADYCNEIVHGKNWKQKVGIHIYQDTQLKHQTIRWTGGNDRHHQEKSTTSRHRDGMGLDFIILGKDGKYNGGLDRGPLDPDGTKYSAARGKRHAQIYKYNGSFVNWSAADTSQGTPNCQLKVKPWHIKLEGWYTSDQVGFHELMYDNWDFKTNKSSLDADLIEHIRGVNPETSIEKDPSREGQLAIPEISEAGKPPWAPGNNYPEDIYGSPVGVELHRVDVKGGAYLLNKYYYLFTFLRLKFPNLFFKDEYRAPGGTTYGQHFHFGGFAGGTPVLTIDRDILENENKLFVKEINDYVRNTSGGTVHLVPES